MACGVTARPSRRYRAVAVSARLKVEPFSGTNVYYLLAKSKKGWSDGNQEVLRTLDQVKEVGFTVIRMWAYQDDPDPNKGGTLQYKDTDGQIKYNQDMLDGLTWLLDECDKRGLKLMMTMTNGNPKEFGGMRQYVRWSKNLAPEHLGGPEVKNGAFFDDPGAQALYRSYLAFMIKKYKDHPALHSWDLANEPRCEGDATASKMSKWIDETASFVKGLDSRTPITVGMDGFFGPSSPDLAQGDAHNPYWGNPYIEGCDFVGDFRSAAVDFASIHLYPYNWNIPVDKRVDFSLRWINDHIEACKNPKYGLNNIPLVLQEYNLTPNSQGRTQMFQKISDLLVEQTKQGDVFKGSMVWMLSDPAEAQWDSEDYYLYAPSVSNKVGNRPLNDEQVAVLAEMSAKLKPEPAPTR